MMEPLAKTIHRVIVLLCIVLFLAGALWNLCFPEEPDTAIIAEQNASMETIAVSLTTADTAEQQETQELESRIAALRIQRDAAWQQLYHAVEQLEFAEKQQKLQQYAELQYTEQQLELLLSAKSMEQCLAVLTPQQANLLVPEAVLRSEYEKLYDLVLRNTAYDETQIVLVPLK